VEGCVFRGDLEIPTPPPSDSGQEDSLTVRGRMFGYPVRRMTPELRGSVTGVRTMLELCMPVMRPTTQNHIFRKVGVASPALIQTTIFPLPCSQDLLWKSVATPLQMSLTAM
jgi:hypothetical protein